MQKVNSDRVLYYGWFIVAATFFSAVVTSGSRSAFGLFVIPMSEDFDWNRTTISLAFFVATLVSGLSQPIVGRLYDSFGGRRVILTSLAALGVLTMLLSLTFHIIFLILMYGVVLSVAMSGGSLNLTILLVAKWFRRKRASAVGLSTAGSSVGGLLIIIFAAYLMDLTGWRVTWLALGALILVLALPLCYVLLRDDPSDMGLLPDGDPIEPDVGGAPEVPPDEGPLVVERWSDSFKSPPMWQLCGSFSVCGFTTAIVAMHFVPYAEGEGFSRSMAATAFGLMNGLNVIGVILMTVLSDRFGRKNLLSSVYAMRGVGYVILILAPGGWSLWGFAVVAGFSWIATAPLTTTLTADIYGLKNLGTLAGLAFLAHQMGGAISVLLAGIIYDATGSYVIPFTICAMLLAAATVVAFSVREKQYSSNYRAQAATGAPTVSW